MACDGYGVVVPRMRWASSKGGEEVVRVRGRALLESGVPNTSVAIAVPVDMPVA